LERVTDTFLYVKGRETEIRLKRKISSEIIKGGIFFARIILGGVFIYASIDKIAFPENFANIIRGYNLIPESFVGLSAFVLPWIELIIGIMLVIGLFIKESSIIITSLLSIFLFAIIIQVTKGPIEDCGCFGKMPFFSSSNSYFLILRNLILISLSIMIFLVELKRKSIEGNKFN